MSVGPSALVYTRGATRPLTTWGMLESWSRRTESQRVVDEFVFPPSRPVVHVGSLDSVFTVKVCP